MTGLTDIDSTTQVRAATLIAWAEGPTVDKDGTVYFSDVRGNRIMRLATDGGLGVFRSPANNPNGMVIDQLGRLIVCEAGEPSQGLSPRVTRTDLATGRTDTLTPSFAGLRTSAPSDVTFDGAGRIYFTVDERPPFLASYHHNAGDDAGEQQAAIGVYRIDSDGMIVQVLRRPQLHRPNGLALSPDDRALYVIENDISAGGTRQLLAFALSAAGQATKKRVLKDFYPGRSGDGLAVDCEGHIYVAAGLNALRGTAETLDTRAGIHVFTPHGQAIRFIPILEDSVTNLTFAGEDMRTVYVTAGKTLFTFVNDVPGLSR